ncbi:phosphate ABC transporter substrate-binding protein PstS [Planotetraspora silvatica]|uniref:Phosphate ABC transporter substrate-binding protein PstS n=1 Tax=Planotetraspora silvatica TaxID=234614 RepID=A0A8J3XLV0_9ACTN|nr:phosphate ABC transporter substrate-binding protein PstS [Planotetraspora silvatica]GII44541.1 phosphate ABC transporter substrate-binding protein PstS [Planotetraspora silvatica]
MPRHPRAAARTVGLLTALLSVLASVLLGSAGTAAAAAGYTPVAGAGSTWAQNAVDQWRKDVNQYGMRISYAGTGSSDGRRQFLSGTTDFAVSDIPFQTHPTDGSAPENPASGSYAYMPIVAGGTAFMYHLTIGGKRVTSLRLSGDVLTKIFTRAVTYWDDAAIAADNPSLKLPHRTIVPVVRSDGSGSTAQFTLWMASQQKALWQAYCKRVGRAGACGETSYFPTVPGMIAQSGDLGVAGYVAQGYGEGAIGYVNYSYALNAHFPVAKVLNHAGYYTLPTPSNVAVSLLKAKINPNKNSADYLTQDLSKVYTDDDRRNYTLSSYSYMILPLKVQGIFTTAKGKTLGAFAYYFMCQGQQKAPDLGYSPLPINLVQAGFDQIRRIPGVAAQNINIKGCNNPTFSSDGSNKLAKTAPFPSACDKKGADSCTTGGGASGSGGGGTSGSPGGSGGTTGGTPGTDDKPGTGGTTPGGAAGAVDPVTGQNPTTSGGATGAPAGTATDGTVVLADPVTVAAETGWSGTQTLMLLAVLAVLGLVLLPAVVARMLGSQKNPSA